MQFSLKLVWCYKGGPSVHFTFVWIEWCNSCQDQCQVITVQPLRYGLSVYFTFVWIEWYNSPREGDNSREITFGCGSVHRCHLLIQPPWESVCRVIPIFGPWICIHSLFLPHPTISIPWGLHGLLHLLGQFWPDGLVAFYILGFMVLILSWH